MDTYLLKDEPITYDLDVRRGNLNFVFNTSSHYALPLCEI